MWKIAVFVKVLKERSGRSDIKVRECNQFCRVQRCDDTVLIVVGVEGN